MARQSPSFINPKGFTLIELLVVTAMIALLMAILMPSLQRVRRQAKALGCQANLRQWVWEVWLRSQMIRSGTVAEPDQVQGLLDQLNLVDRQWPFGYLSLNHIKALAARSAIARYDDTVLRAVDARLDQAIQAKSYESAPDPRKRRQELADNRSYLQKVLQDRPRVNEAPKTKP